MNSKYFWVVINSCEMIDWLIDRLICLKYCKTALNIIEFLKLNYNNRVYLLLAFCLEKFLNETTLTKNNRFKFSKQKKKKLQNKKVKNTTYIHTYIHIHMYVHMYM